MQSTRDVVIVGAGPAGLGTALALRDAGVGDLLLLDRAGIGASFERWPRETRFITPSFAAAAFGCPDLNAIGNGTEPAAFLETGHPHGIGYARYLREIARRENLDVVAPVEVLGLEGHAGNFVLRTNGDPIRAGIVVWATGEFQSGRRGHFPGQAQALSFAEIPSFAELAGDDFLVLGGGESGMDAACHLVGFGKRVRVLDRSGHWLNRSGDPSDILSPVTRQRLEQALSTGRLDLRADVTVSRIEECCEGFVVWDKEGHRFHSVPPPIDCLGFAGGADLLRGHWAWDGAGQIVLGPGDESTKTPGLFLAGPQVRHGGAPFCYIYKFRTRFPLLAAAVAARLESLRITA